MYLEGDCFNYLLLAPAATSATTGAAFPRFLPDVRTDETAAECLPVETPMARPHQQRTASPHENTLLDIHDSGEHCSRWAHELDTTAG